MALFHTRRQSGGGFGINHGELLRIPCQGGVAERVLPDVKTQVFGISPRKAFCSLFVQRPDFQEHRSYTFAPFAGGPSSRVGRLPVPNRVFTTAASVAGDRLVVTVLVSVAEDLMLLRGLR